MAVVLLPFFLAMLVVSVIGMYLDSTPDRRLIGVVLVGSFWSFMVGVTAWLLMASRRYSIILGNDDVTFTGMWSDLSLRLSDVTQAKWQMPARSLTLKLRKRKKTIVFREYRLDHRRELVRYFRERIDPGLQSGWDGGWERYADPDEDRADRRRSRQNLAITHCLP
jgi:hypothetical protein